MTEHNTDKNRLIYLHSKNSLSTQMINDHFLSSSSLTLFLTQCAFQTKHSTWKKVEGGEFQTELLIIFPELDDEEFRFCQPLLQDILLSL